MPNTASAKKRLRQNVVRRARNSSDRSSIRTQIHKVREAIAEDPEAFEAIVLAPAFRRRFGASLLSVYGPAVA